MFKYLIRAAGRPVLFLNLVFKSGLLKVFVDESRGQIEVVAGDVPAQGGLGIRLFPLRVVKNSRTQQERIAEQEG